MQLTGDRFTTETAVMGNDLATLPDFPAEIRAPAGTLPGVSAFQLHFADHDIMTPGDAPNVLVAMNPAALKANLERPASTASDVIVNTDEFTPRNLKRVGYAENPLDDGSLDAYRVHPNRADLDDRRGSEGHRHHQRRRPSARKNMFALGLLCWLYHRPTDGTLAFLDKKFASKPELLRSNRIAFEAGWSFGETTEDFSVSYEIKPAVVRPGTYRNISGNLALAYGLLAASCKFAAAAVPWLVPDHASVRHLARAQQAQTIRCSNLPGRGRDCRHRCCSWRRLWWTPWCHGDVGARLGTEERNHWSCRLTRTCPC